VQLKGVVTRLDWANPHVYFYIDVKDDDENTLNWGCETSGPGDQVTVDGYLAKDGSNRVDARNVTFADGRRVFAGTQGDVGPTK
jgi:hypothetical protein